jgi:hypothetical protein
MAMLRDGTVPMIDPGAACPRAGEREAPHRDVDRVANLVDERRAAGG